MQASILILLLAGLCVCGGGAPAVSNKLSVSVSTDKPSYRQGESVQIRHVIQNVSSSNVKFSDGGNTAREIQVRAGDSIVHNNFVVCAAEGCDPQPTLIPGATSDYTFRWDQNRGTTDNPVPTGAYQIQGFASTVDGDTQRIASNAITIQIVP